MAAVLKLKRQDEIHRIRLAEISYQKLESTIASLWPDLSARDFKYTDEEGDLCTLSEASFSDFVALSAGDGVPQVLKLEHVADAAPVECEPSPAGPHQVPCLWASVDDHVKGHWQAMKQAWKWHHKEVLGHGGGWHGHCHGAGPFKPRKLIGYLSSLRSGGMLNGETAAALLVQSLPNLIEALVNRAEGLQHQLQHWLQHLLPTLKESLEELCRLARATPGMEGCAEQLANLVRGEAPLACEAVLAMLTALNSLPFEARVSFVQAFFTTQESRLNEFLDQERGQWWSFYDRGWTYPAASPGKKDAAQLEYEQVCAACVVEVTLEAGDVLIWKNLEATHDVRDRGSDRRLLRLHALPADGRCLSPFKEFQELPPPEEQFLERFLPGAELNVLRSRGLYAELLGEEWAACKAGPEVATCEPSEASHLEMSEACSE